MSKQRLELTWYNKDKALIPTETGKYGYTWVEPSDPRYCETHTLIVDEVVRGVQSPKSDEFEYSERADLPTQDDNLLILGESGDVLEALTRVPELADKYVGKVKLVYIDPPFNTGDAFPSYEDNLEHSVWLTLMRDRLLHLRRLLSEDGSIWVHLDDIESHRMRILLDEVFGAGNFASEIVWQKRTTRENRSHISTSTDHIFVYAKRLHIWKKSRNLLPRTSASGYSNPDNDPRGPWTSVPFTAQFNEDENPRFSQRYSLRLPTGVEVEPPIGSVWRFTQERYMELLSENRLWFGVNGDSRPRLKKFASEVADGLVPTSLWSANEVGSNDTAKREIQTLFPECEAFTTPKPERLLERIIHISTNPGDLVLDAFAGSGTTAAVAQKMGRRWVTCELRDSNFNTYTRPRLEKVVNDQDPGGVSRTAGERIAAEGVDLPDGVSAEDAAKFTSVLNKLIADDPEAKKSPLVKTLKAAAKTRRTKEVVNWRGGGGFTVAHLSPQCFDYDPDVDRVMLTEAATGPMLVESVRVNLGFSALPPSSVFDGVRGRSVLKVFEGVATTGVVDALVACLEEDQCLVLACTGVEDGVREHLRKVSRGSRLIHVPDDVFTMTTGEGL